MANSNPTCQRFEITAIRITEMQAEDLEKVVSKGWFEFSGG